MAEKPIAVEALTDRRGQLERAFIEEFLRGHGYDLHTLRDLPEEQVQHLMREASLYAAAKLAEVEARAHFIHEIHGER